MMMKAVIMAGGKGSRLRPLTCNLPKPMMPVMNKPLMFYTLELLKEHNIKDIAVTLQYMPEVIRGYFGKGEDQGVNLEYFEELTPLGTAGGVRNAAEFLDKTFIAVSGDALTDFDLSQALEFHGEKGGLCTMVLTRRDCPLEFGVCTLDEDNRLTRYREKPGWGEVFSDTVNTGIYILEPEIFHLVPPETFFDFSKDLFPLMMEKNLPIYGFTARGYWSDIGDLEQYRQAHIDILQGKIKVAPGGSFLENNGLVDREPADNVRVGRNTTIDPGARVEGPVFIGDNCHLPEGAFLGEYTVLGHNNRLEAGAALARTIVWNNNYIGPAAQLQGTIIGNSCVVKSKAAALEGSVVSDGCSIGSGSIIKAGVKLWPGKHVGDNLRVNTSIIWEEGAGRQHFGVSGIRGIPNVEITPEFVTRLAAAYGTVLEPGREIVVSSHQDSFCQILKTSFLAGLLSAGINALDIGTATTPVNRYGVKVLEGSGGVHLGLVEDSDAKKGNDPKIWIEILDNYGINAHRNFERKIENTLGQEEFRRVNFRKVGEVRHLPQLGDSYRERLTRTVQKDIIRPKRFRVVAAYPQETLSPLVKPLLEKLGCQVITVAGDKPSGDTPLKGGGEYDSCSREDLAEAVKKSCAHLGVLIDSNGEKLTLVTEEGQILGEDIKSALLLRVALTCSGEKNIAVPVSAPHIMEELAQECQGQAVRTRVNSRAVMEVTRDSLFQLHYDALYMLVLILQYMAQEDKKLSQMVEEIPAFHMHQASVPTRWQDVGKIMRNLAQESREQGWTVEMIDGLKIFYPLKGAEPESQVMGKGWTLILPRPDEPVFQVISQSTSPGEAEELCSFYREKIQKIQG